MKLKPIICGLIVLFIVVIVSSYFANREGFDGAGTECICPKTLTSTNGKYKVVSQEDGNLVVYNDNIPLWWSGTNRLTPRYTTIITPNGEYILKDEDTELWKNTENSKGNGTYTLIMQDDGNLVLYDSANHPYWASGTNKIQGPANEVRNATNSVTSGFYSVTIKDKLTSNNGRFHVDTQSDGNLVVYDGTTPLWASGTNQPSQYTTRITSDGEYILKDDNNRVLWGSKTAGKGIAPFTLQMRDDGNLVLYDSLNKALWASGTYVGRESTPPPGVGQKDLPTNSQTLDTVTSTNSFVCQATGATGTAATGGTDTASLVAAAKTAAAKTAAAKEALDKAKKVFDDADKTLQGYQAQKATLAAKLGNNPAAAIALLPFDNLIIGSTSVKSSMQTLVNNLTTAYDSALASSNAADAAAAAATKADMDKSDKAAADAVAAVAEAKAAKDKAAADEAKAAKAAVDKEAADKAAADKVVADKEAADKAAAAAAKIAADKAADAARAAASPATPVDNVSLNSWRQSPEVAAASGSQIPAIIAAAAPQNSVVPQLNNITPDNSVSPTTALAQDLQKRSSFIEDVQTAIKNALIDARNTPVVPQQDNKMTNSLKQGQEYNCNNEKEGRCPRYPDGTCPPAQDMSKYIAKDAIPCWGCNLDY